MPAPPYLYCSTKAPMPLAGVTTGGVSFEPFSPATKQAPCDVFGMAIDEGEEAGRDRPQSLPAPRR